MFSHYDINTLIAVSLVHATNMAVSKIIPILDKKKRHFEFPVKFDAALYEDILLHLQETFPEWIQFILAQKADEVNRGVERLRRGMLGRLERSPEEPTFEGLKRIWTSFVREGPLRCVLDEEGGLWTLDHVASGEGELEMLPEIEFFDDQGNRIPV